jgi:hypothetical protein
MIITAVVLGALATLGAASRRSKASQPALVPVRAERRRSSR